MLGHNKKVEDFIGNLTNALLAAGHSVLVKPFTGEPDYVVAPGVHFIITDTEGRTVRMTYAYDQVNNEERDAALVLAGEVMYIERALRFQSEVKTQVFMTDECGLADMAGAKVEVAAVEKEKPAEAKPKPKAKPKKKAPAKKAAKKTGGRDHAAIAKKAAATRAANKKKREAEEQAKAKEAPKREESALS